MTTVSFDLIALNVITGFLGSGKTTLLRNLLTSDLGNETAVLINEFGEVGIDHLLVSEVAPDTVLLKSGCVCCSIRGELKDALIQLFSRRQKGEVPKFRRVILETTGLADPAPIFATILADPMLQHHFRLGVIVTVVDSFNAALHEESHPEWMAQVTAADRLVLTKRDLVDQQSFEAIRKKLQTLNPAALILTGEEIKPQDPLLLTAGLHDAGPEKEVEHWIEHSRSHSQGKSNNFGAGSDHEHSTHSRIHSFCLVFDYQIDWPAFGLWLSMLLNRHGRNILRVKGILNLSGADYPVAIHGVQHLVHPPVHLPEWPDRDRRSRIVFIVDGLDLETIEGSFKTFCEYLN